jgi:hypothetical protein
MFRQIRPDETNGAVSTSFLHRHSKILKHIASRIAGGQEAPTMLTLLMTGVANWNRCRPASARQSFGGHVNGELISNNE